MVLSFPSQDAFALLWVAEIKREREEGMEGEREKGGSKREGLKDRTLLLRLYFFLYAHTSSRPIRLPLGLYVFPMAYPSSSRSILPALDGERIFLNHWQVCLLLWRCEHGIFNVHNSLSVWRAHKRRGRHGQTCTRVDHKETLAAL